MKKKAWLIVILLGLLVVLPSKGVAESTAVVWYDVVVKVFSDGTYIATLRTPDLEGFQDDTIL